MSPDAVEVERRVAALEAALERLEHPLLIGEFPPMDEAEQRRFREEFEAAAGKPREYRILPSSPTVLDPEAVRQLLRESVTVVKPGETLFLTCPEYCTPAQVREIQDGVNWWLRENAPDVKMLILPAGKMAVAEGHPDFMTDVRVYTYRHERVESVRLTHLPTGIAAVGPTKDEAVAKLATALAAAGEITLNDGRRALGLPEWKMPEADSPLTVPQG